jgi:uroporphyrinogen III methyltransferase / synthase
MVTAVDRPLAGVGVVVTREEGAEAALTAELRQLGATILTWPTTRTAPPADPGPVRRAVARLEDFHWAPFTSARAVEAVFAFRPAWPPAVRIATVGRATGRAVRERGWPLDLVPGRQTAQALVAGLEAAGVGAGTRVLFPASEIARETLETGLRRLGAEVVRVAAYRTLPAPAEPERWRAALRAGEVQVISIASPSALENLRAALGVEGFRAAAAVAVIAAIGPATAAAARAAGAVHVIEAEDHSLAGLAARIAAWGRDQSRQERHELSDP